MTLRSSRLTTLLLLAGALTAAGVAYSEDLPKDTPSPSQSVEGSDSAAPQAPKPQDAQPDPQKMQAAGPMLRPAS
jgi:hypothetical protein